VRRVTADGGWAATTLIHDCTREECGYDFLCSLNGAETKVEVKTFKANGRVPITPLDLREAQLERGHYRLVGFVYKVHAPQRWRALFGNGPFPTQPIKMHSARKLGP
jgi:Domain of unknown function (DUF3883)